MFDHRTDERLVSCIGRCWGAAAYLIQARFKTLSVFCVIAIKFAQASLLWQVALESCWVLERVPRLTIFMQEGRETTEASRDTSLVQVPT